MRIHEFAKQIGRDSKEIIAILVENGIEGKKTMSSIAEHEMELVLNKLKIDKNGNKKEEKPVQKEKPKNDKPQEKSQAKQENRKKDSNSGNQGNQGKQNHQQNNQNNQNNQNQQNNQKNGKNNRDKNRQDNNAKQAKNDADKHISKVYNPQNSGGSKNNNNKNNNAKNNNNDRNGNNRNNAHNNNNNGNRNGGKNNRNNKPAPAVQPVKKEEEIKMITLPESLTIGELADKMKMPSSALIKKLFMQGMMLNVNSEVDYETAEGIALEFDIIAEQEEKVDVIEELLREDEEDESTMVTRPPVVCVMGHVDHGKTSLLDAIRKSNVISGEAGGITQHIGAYVVNCNGQKITFLDTPGHEAFTAMRMRGAQATDIAILVVAADDGVMPQTVEAISHAKAAGISIIVAVNKIDKPSANVEKVKQELAEYELLAEDWGGDTVFVPVSAHTGEGLDQLLEMVLLTAEMNELKANPNRKARGVVIEAKLDKGRGPVATVLIQKGTLKSGDAVAIGSAYGRVRAMIADNGDKLKEAGPSTPVEILGLNSVPNAGEIMMATKNEKEARNIAETFITEGREKLLEGARAKAKMTLDDIFNQIQAGSLKELNIIVKADVQGSVEAVRQSLVKLSNDEVVVKVIHGGVGAINESDVSLASASNAIIIGFNVRPDNTAKEIAERESVDLRLYRVIYQAIEDVEAAMKGMLDPVYEEKVIGHAEIRQLFKSSGVGLIAGSYILDGSFQRGCKVRISREGEQIFEGDLASLKRFKDDVKEVKAGYECGLVFEGFTGFQELDIVEAYIMVEVPR
jgi:translation initiation factor IF-2